MLQFDAATFDSFNGENPSIVHTNTGADRLLLIWFTAHFASMDVTSVTVGGAPASFVGRSEQEPGVDSAIVECWGLVAAPSGPVTIEWQLASAVPHAIQVISYAGVHQGMVLGQGVPAGGANTTPSIAIPTATGELAVAGMYLWSFGDDADETITPESGQVHRAEELWLGGGPSGGMVVAADQAAADPSTSMDWTLGRFSRWAMVGMRLQAAGGAAAVTVQPALIASAAQVAAPAVIASPATIQPPLIPGNSAVPTPTVAHVPATVQASMIASTAQVFTPTVQAGIPTGEVRPPAIQSEAVMHTPAIVRTPVLVTPAVIPSRAAVEPPTVQAAPVAVTPARTESAALVHAAVVQATPATVRPSLIGGMAAVLTPTLLVNPGLIPVPAANIYDGPAKPRTYSDPAGRPKLRTYTGPAKPRTFIGGTMARVLRKHRLERALYAIDYAAELEDGETITAILDFLVVRRTAAGEDDVTAEFRDGEPDPSIVGTAVRAWLKAAEDGQQAPADSYGILCRVRTSIGRELVRENADSTLPRLIVSDGGAPA